MSVPADSSVSCSDVESALLICQSNLVAARRTASLGCPISPISADSSPALFLGDQSEDAVPLIICGLLLCLLFVLHVARQAWYAWGGEGAFAFPFDK
jgi:hypothetical protein